MINVGDGAGGDAIVWFETERVELLGWHLSFFIFPMFKRSRFEPGFSLNIDGFLNTNEIESFRNYHVKNG